VAAQEIRDKVNLIVNNLPDTAKAPVVQKFDPDATPIMQIALSSPRPLREVTEIADKQIKPQLENINGIGQIQLVGGLKREIRVWVDPDKMRGYNLAIFRCGQRTSPAEYGMPAGNVNAGARELAVRTLGRLVDPAQFNEIAIANARIVRGEAPRHRLTPRIRKKSRHRRAAEMAIRRNHGGFEAIGTKHGGRRRRFEGGASSRWKRRCPKTSTSRSPTTSPSLSRPAVHSLEQHLIEGSILAAPSSSRF